MPKFSLEHTFMMNFGGKLPIFDYFCNSQPNLLKMTLSREDWPINQRNGLHIHALSKSHVSGGGGRGRIATIFLKGIQIYKISFGGFLSILLDLESSWGRKNMDGFRITFKSVGVVC